MLLPDLKEHMLEQMDLFCLYPQHLLQRPARNEWGAGSLLCNADFSIP